MPSYRAVIKLGLVCAECGEQLTVSDDVKDHTFGARNAFELETNIKVNHCQKCYKDAIEPSRLIGEAMEMLQSKVKAERATG